MSKNTHDHLKTVLGQYEAVAESLRKSNTAREIQPSDLPTIAAYLTLAIAIADLKVKIENVTPAL